jgi:hypothetical protein
MIMTWLGDVPLSKNIVLHLGWLLAQEYEDHNVHNGPFVVN